MSTFEETEMEDNAAVLDADYDDEEEGAETPVPSCSCACDEDAQALAVLEGLLFITGDEGLSAKQAGDSLERTEAQADELLRKLQKKYADDAHGIEIARFGNVYRFLSKAFVHQYAARLFSLEKNTKLSPAALETLAIIAYRQPITRVEIEEIRGVSADVMLRKLQARGLIREAGRSDAPGRPILYAVTDEFMNSFQLMSLDELPELPSFQDEEKNGSDLFER